MVANNVAMTTEGMQLAAKEFEYTYDAVIQQMQNLKLEMDVLKPQWRGEAANVFQKTMHDWGVEFDKITFHLDAMADMMIGGAGHATQAEDAAIQDGQFFKLP